MVNDIMKTYGASNTNWDVSQTTKSKVKGLDFEGEFASAVSRTDTIEISNPQREDYSLSIKKERNDLSAQLSNVHTDVNKFLNIKEQVRTGNYELNASEIAQGIASYSIY